MVKANVQYIYDPKTGTLKRDRQIPEGFSKDQLKQIKSEKDPGKTT